MKLYNCESSRELELKDIDLSLLKDDELKNLADNILIMFENGELEDENIVVNALHQIIQKQEARLREYYKIARGVF